MSSDVLVCRVKEAAETANWSMLYRYLNQFLSTTNHLNVMADVHSVTQLIDPVIQEEGDDNSSEHAKQRIEQITEDVIDSVLYALKIGDFQARWDLAKVLPSFGKATIVPLISLLEDANEEEDWELTWFVARILGAYPCAEAIAALSSLLRQSLQPDVIVVAIDGLASIGPSAVPTLKILAQEPQTRLPAIQALAQIHHPEVIQSLMAVADDPDLAIRSVAIAALGHVHRPEVTALLIKALTDHESKVRRAAVIGLGLQIKQVPEFQFLEVIQPLLWDISLDVRRQTILTLSRLKSSRAAQVLFTVLQSSDTPVMLHADILRAMIWTETSEALHNLQKFVQTCLLPTSIDHQVQVLHQIAKTLQLVDQEPLKILATSILGDVLLALNNQIPQHSGRHADGLHNAELKQAIAHSLGSLGQTNSISLLQELLLDSDKRVQLHAEQAIKKIMG